VEHETAAFLLRREFRRSRLAQESDVAVRIVQELRQHTPGLNSWVNFPLFNASGDPSDFSLSAYKGGSRPTAYSEDLPYSANIVKELMSEGFDVSHARIAVLLPRDVLRCHVDMHRAIRLIVPLTESENFRHVFGRMALAMRVGELWSLDPTVCHGAANISSTGHRVALLVDARPDSTIEPAWFNDHRHLPASRALARRPWPGFAPAPTVQRAQRYVEAGQVEMAEREWHFLPFEYDLSPESAYEQLVLWCRKQGDRATTAQDRSLWQSRASYWRRHNCVCVA